MLQPFKSSPRRRRGRRAGPRRARTSRGSRGSAPWRRPCCRTLARAAACGRWGRRGGLPLFCVLLVSCGEACAGVRRRRFEFEFVCSSMACQQGSLASEVAALGRLAAVAARGLCEAFVESTNEPALLVARLTGRTSTVSLVCLRTRKGRRNRSGGVRSVDCRRIDLVLNSYSSVRGSRVRGCR